MLPSRTDASLFLVLASTLLASPLLAQTPSETPSAPSLVPTISVPTTAPAGAVSAETITVSQPFVATITSDKVYVRSGPGTAHYEIGQLAKGDTVQVVGARNGWYQILPPNGSFNMIAKEFVETDADGKTGIVKGDYINVRAGTAVYPTREPQSVLMVARKGTKLTILGSTDKYYKIAPLDRAFVFVAPQFVKKSDDNAEYKIPALKYPAGVTGIGTDTVTTAVLPAATGTIEIVPVPSNTGTSTPPDNTTTATTTKPTDTAIEKPTDVAVTTAPKTYAEGAYAKFNDINSRTQLELRKPLMDRNYDALLAEYKSLLATADLPPSVKQGSEARQAYLEKLAAVQKAAKENATSSAALDAERKAIQTQYEESLKALEAYQTSGPYLAEGTLKTSGVMTSKYIIVNPTTGRTVAYVDPASDIDVSKLLGEYVGIRGNTVGQVGSEVNVIKVKTITMLPTPKLPK